MEMTDSILNGPGATQYPIFRANQVLTDQHLNDAVAYLERQTRLTRTALVGTGVLCGLHPTLGTVQTVTEDGEETEIPSLVLSSGCGVTTRGHLLVESGRSLTHARRALLDAGDLPGVDVAGGEAQSAIFECYTEAEAGDVKPDNDNPVQLFEATPTGPETSLADVLAEWVVVLLLKVRSEERDSCMYSCDEAGTRRTFDLRPLVMAPDTFEGILRAGFDPSGQFAGNDLDAVFNRPYDLPALRLERFAAGPTYGDDQELVPGINLQKIYSLEAYVDAFVHACVPGDDPAETAAEIRADVASVADAYRHAYRVFHPFFTGVHPDSESDFESLEEQLAERLEELQENEKELADLDSGSSGFPERRGIQYFYDYLGDLVHAYEELRETAFELMDDCLPPEHRFPRHLALGRPGGAPGCPPSIYRSHYAQPPVYNGNARRLQAVHTLYARMHGLASAFVLPEDDPDEVEVRITPSRQVPASLGERALPFYYHPDAPSGAEQHPLYHVWSPDHARRCSSARVRSYHAPFDDSRPAAEPLLSRIDGVDFYRIEGHVGKRREQAVGAIGNLRRRYNLPFDLLALKIGVEPGGDLDPENVQYTFHFDDLSVLYQQAKEDVLCMLDEVEDQARGDLSDDVQDAVDDLREGLTLDEGDEIGDYYSLLELSRDDHFDEFRSHYQVVLAWRRRDDASYVDCVPETIEPLLEEYRERTATLRQQMLFHKYAHHHPGMEHQGGVPRGGTFILVYVNEGEEAIFQDVERDLLASVEDQDEGPNAALFGKRSEDVSEAVRAAREAAREAVAARKAVAEKRAAALERARESLAEIDDSNEIAESLDELIRLEMATRTDVVVGDFALPYRCCGETSFSFVVAQPRPLVLLPQVSYCEDDDGPYDFTLDPPNGFLEGPGVDASSGQYQFVPSHPEVQAQKPEDGSWTVAFTYRADGGTDTLTVEILPRRDASFEVDGLPDADTLCLDPNEQSRFRLIPDESGGTFSTETDEWLVEDDGQTYFDAAAVPDGTTVTITHTLPAADDACAARAERTLTVAALPDAGFTELEDAYCRTDAPVTLSPNASGAESTFRSDPDNAVTGSPSEGWTFNPSALNPDVGGQQVTVTHVVRDPSTGCENQAVQTTTVLPVPSGEFDGIGDEVCQNDEEVPLRPRMRGDALTSTFETDPAGAIVERDDTFFFDPSRVTVPGGAESVDVTITHTITGPGDCTGEGTQTVTVYSLPDPDFSGLQDTYCIEDDTNFPVSLQPNETGDAYDSTFTSNLGGKVVVEDDNGEWAFRPFQALWSTDGRTVDVTITHTITGPGGCSASSEQTVTVAPVPNAGFRVEWDGDGPIPRSAGPIDLLPDASEVDSQFTSDSAAGVVDRADGGWFFFPSEVPPSENEKNVVVRITHVATDPGTGCNSEEVREVTVQRSSGDDQSNRDGDAPQLDGDAIGLLNRRGQEYLDAVETLAREEEIQSTSSYTGAKGFLDQNIQQPPEDTVDAYAAVLNTLLQGLAQTNRKEVWTRLIEIATHRLMDRLVATAPRPSRDLRDSVEQQMDRLRSASDVDLAEIADAWDAAALRGTLTGPYAAAVNTYEGLMG
jgi:hypothetical protein